MSKHTKPMEFFKGSKRGIFLEAAIVEEVITLLSDLDNCAGEISDIVEFQTEDSTDLEHLDKMYGAKTAIDNIHETLDRLRTTASASIADEITSTLNLHSGVADETKAGALRIALGRLVMDD